MTSMDEGPQNPEGRHRRVARSSSQLTTLFREWPPLRRGLRRFLLLVCGLAVGLSFVSVLSRTAAVAADLPSRISDQELWRIAVDFSEPNGFFRSDNLTSNELWFQRVIPELISRTRPGGAYLGVGPEQNFTYIAAIRPAIAIIFDIRRGNMLLQWMYKAIFEVATDRADFVSMLFSKARPPGLGAKSTANELFEAFDNVEGSEVLYKQNLRIIEDRLTIGHRLPLPPEDLAGIEYVFQSFYRGGFAVRFSPTYDELMTETDGTGTNRSYLATEESFEFVKALESKNLVIPLVGDFGGPKAIRAVGDYLKSHGATVAAFYLSNVEQYLSAGRWMTFCRSVTMLPLDATSTFIRSSSNGYGFGPRGPRFVSSLGRIAEEVKACSGS